jgi:hypothetical protein
MTVAFILSRNDTFYSLPIDVCPVLSAIVSHDCFHLAIILKPVAAKVLLQRCKYDPWATNSSDIIKKTGNVRITTLRRVRATSDAVEKQWVLHKKSVCICSLSCPACNAHAPYYHLWLAPLYNIFPHFLTNGTIFEKKSYWLQNVCFDFLYNVCLKHSHSKKKWARYDNECILVFV